MFGLNGQNSKTESAKANFAKKRTQPKLGSFFSGENLWVEVSATCFSKGYILSSFSLPAILVLVLFALTPETWKALSSASCILSLFIAIFLVAITAGLFCFCIYALIALLRGLAKSQSQLRSIIQAMPIGIAVLSEEGTIQYVNPALARMLNEQTGTLVGKEFAQIIDAPAQVISPSADDSVKEVELFAKRSDGNTLPVVLSISPFQTGKAANRIASIIDISDKYETQQLKKSLVAVFSHEMKNPLMAIDGYLQLLSRGLIEEPAQIKEKASRAGKNCGRLLTLISDLIELEKLDTGFGQLSSESVSIALLLDQSLEAVRELAEQKHISFDLEVADVELNIDQERMTRLFINLLHNAIKYSPQDGAIKIKARPDSAGLKVEIIDEGQGIDPKYHDRLFKPFQRIEGEDAVPLGGSGLGLAICKQIVSEHGGQIGVSSEAGVGSNFWIHLPAALILGTERVAENLPVA